MKRIVKLPLYILFFICILISAVIYIYYFTTLPETELNNYFRGVAAKNTGFEVSFQKINRDIWNGLILDGVEILPGDGSQPPVAYISRISLEYSLFDLLGANYKFRTLAIDSIYVRIPRSGLNLPGKEGRNGSGRTRPSFAIDEIRVTNGVFALNDTDIVEIDSLRGSLAFNKDSLAVDIKNISADWPRRDIALRSLTGAAHSSGGRYIIDSLVAATGKSRIHLAGSTGDSFTRELEIDLVASSIRIDEIARMTGIKISGNMEIDGHLSGSLDNFQSRAILDGVFMEKPFDSVEVAFSYSDGKISFDTIRGDIFNASFDGSGSLDFAAKPEQYRFRGMVRHLDLREIAPQLKTDFTGNVNVAGAGFKEENFTMTIDGDFDSVRIETYYFDKVSGSIEFDTKAISFLPGFQGRYKDTYVTAEGFLEYQGSLDIIGGAVFEDLTDFTNQLFVRELGGRGKADFHLTGLTADFAVRGSFESDSAWTYGLEPGRLSIFADLRSFISHRVGHVSGFWTGGQAYSIPTDSGRFETVVSGEKVFLDHVAIDGPNWNARMRGEFDGASIPPTFLADTLFGIAAGNRFFSRRPVVLAINGDVTEIKQAVMGLSAGGLDAGTIIAKGNVTNDMQADMIFLNIDIDAADFQIRPIVRQFFKEKDISGRWWGEARLRGNFEKPEIDFRIVIDSLNIDTISIGSLHASMRYHDGYLYSDSTRLESDFGVYLFAGVLPLDLSFAEVENRLPERPLDVRMVAKGSRLALAEAFIPTVERFNTEFLAEINLTGTYKNPAISGWGHMLDGELKVIDLVNPLTDLRAYFRMNNEMIYIDSAFAFTPGGGEWVRGLGEFIPGREKAEPQSLIKAHGTMRLVTLGIFDYDISVDAENLFFISDSYDVQGLADADLHVIGNTPPTVAGDITLKRLDVRDEFEAFVAPDYDSTLVLEDSTIWDLNINIRANNNLWIRNTDVEAELKGDLYVERVVGILNILGSLEVIRGDYNLFGLEFKVKSGSMNFQDVAIINPDIDFVVTTRLRSRGNDIASGQSFEPVELYITGTLLEPKIDVAEGSVLTREELLTSLMAGSQLGQLGLIGQDGLGTTDFSRSLIGGALPALRSFIGPLGGEYIEELEISSIDEGARQDYEISVAKYISSSLYVRYAQRLEASGRTIGVEYYVNDNVNFTISRGRVEGTEDEGFSFDLNLNFEY